ncbi:MAG: barnase inhibitor [Porphyromonadaceae bacterium]|jgi:ribonuclease inhibitor|nr:barnase inhibitor [Porphyromonadaceae bacterium]
MRQVIFDFENIFSQEQFYLEVANEFHLPNYFGNNLDALWDCITGDIELPIDIKFINLSIEQMEEFNDFIILFEDAVNELPEEISFEYFIKDNFLDEEIFDEEEE